MWLCSCPVFSWAGCCSPLHCLPEDLKLCLRARAHLCKAGQAAGFVPAGSVAALLLLLLLQMHISSPVPLGSSWEPWTRFPRGMSWLFPTWISSAWARSGGSSWRSNITSTARANTARNSSRMTWCWQWRQEKARYGLSCSVQTQWWLHLLYQGIYQSLGPWFLSSLDSLNGQILAKAWQMTM